MFKSKKYVEGMKDGAKPFEDTLNEVADAKEDFRKLVEIFGKRKANKIIKIYTSDHPTKVKIVNENKEDYDIMDNLRKTLNEKRFDCSSCSYSQYKSAGRGAASYVIFLEDYEKLADKKVENIYKDNFGCRIYRRGDFIVALHDKSVIIENEQEFLKYYESVMHESVEQNKKLKTEFEKRKISAVNDSRYLKMWKIAVDTVDKNLFVGLMQGVFLLTQLPQGITEGVILSIAQTIQEGRANDKILAEVQKQILIVKLTEFMEKERFKLY